MKIGEFARLGQVSVRMLRHYESLGLLIPDTVDRFTGHRSYTVAQLPRLNRIMALNALGISLRKVADLLDAAVTTAELADMLHLRRHQLQAEQAVAAAQLADVDFRLALIERTTMTQPDCIIKELPAERILGRTVTLGVPPFDTSVIGPLFDSVAETIAAAVGRPEIGVGVYSDTEQGTAVTCGYRGDAALNADTSENAETLSGDDLEITELASCSAATLIHEGPINRIGASWQHLSEWCLTQGYSLSGPCREIYLETADDTHDAGWIVELQQPITN